MIGQNILNYDYFLLNKNIKNKNSYFSIFPQYLNDIVEDAQSLTRFPIIIDSITGKKYQLLLRNDKVCYEEVS